MITNTTLGAFTLVVGLGLAAFSGVRARQQAQRLGLEEGSSGTGVVQRLYLGMYLALAAMGGLVLTGIVVPPGTEEPAWEEDEDDGGPGWMAWLRSTVPTRSPSVPTVPLLRAQRATPFPAEHFAFRDADCETHWAVLTLTPEGRWVGGLQVPAGGTRNMLDAELYDALLTLAEAWKDAAASEACGGSATRPFDGDLLVRVHPDVSIHRLQRILFTSGQAQFGTFRLQVDGADAGPEAEGPEQLLHPRWEGLATATFLQTLIDHEGLPTFFTQSEEGVWRYGGHDADDEPPVAAPPTNTQRLPATVSTTRFGLGRIGPEGRPKPPPEPGLTLSNGSILGAAASQAIEERLHQSAEALTACAATPRWSGNLKVTVDADGQFVSPQWAKSTLSGQALGCQRDVIDALSVPPKGTGRALVTITLTHR